MAFCSKCGQQVADGLTVCPACGAPLEAPAAAPQTPNYAAASPKEKLDTIPSEASANFPTFAYIGIGGFVLSLICSLFIPIGKLYGVLCLVSNLMILVGLFMFYNALKKGLVGHKEPCTGLCSASAWLCVISYGLAIITALLAYVFISSSSSYDMAVGGAIATGGLAVITLLVTIAYVVVAIILAAKLLGNYEGNVNQLGVWLLVLSIVSLLSFIPYVGAIATAVVAVLFFLTAIKTISPAK